MQSLVMYSASPTTDGPIPATCDPNSISSFHTGNPIPKALPGNTTPKALPGNTTPKALQSETSPKTLQPEIQPAADRSIKYSFWYQWRSVFSSVSLLTCWGLGIASVTRIPEDSLLAWFMNGTGWAFFTLGVTVRLWATLYIGGRKAKGVIDHGPYSICRNPLYWGTFLVVLSQVLMLKSGIFALGTIVPILIYVCGVVPAEEAYLTQKLGNQYLDYCNRVPRWWPRLANYSSPDVIDVSLRGLRAEVLRILGWIGLPFLTLAICSLRMQSWWYAPLRFW